MKFKYLLSLIFITGTIAAQELIPVRDSPHNKCKSWGCTYYEWKFKSKPEFRYVSVGYEDGLNHSIYQVLPDNKYDQLFRFAPIAKDDDDLYWWAFPWSTHDIPVKIEKDKVFLFIDINQEIKFGGVTELPKWQKRAFPILLHGKPEEGKWNKAPSDYQFVAVSIEDIVELVKEEKKPENIGTRELRITAEWSEPDSKKRLGKLDMVLFPIDPDLDQWERQKSWGLTSDIHSCFTASPYTKPSAEECKSYEKYRKHFYQIPADIQIPDLDYLLSISGQLLDSSGEWRSSDYENIVGGSMEINRGEDIPNSKIHFEFTDSSILRACPFVYSWIGGEYVYQGEIIRNLNDKSKESTQLLPINIFQQDGMIKLLIKEEKHETSYINYLALDINGEIVEPMDGPEEILKIDSKYFNMEFGESLELVFDLNSRGGVLEKAKIISHGYYIPN